MKNTSKLLKVNDMGLGWPEHDAAVNIRITDSFIEHFNREQYLDSFIAIMDKVVILLTASKVSIVLVKTCTFRKPLLSTLHHLSQMLLGSTESQILSISHIGGEHFLQAIRVFYAVLYLPYELFHYYIFSSPKPSLQLLYIRFERIYCCVIFRCGKKAILDCFPQRKLMNDIATEKFLRHFTITV